MPGPKTLLLSLSLSFSPSPSLVSFVTQRKQSQLGSYLRQQGNAIAILFSASLFLLHSPFAFCAFFRKVYFCFSLSLSLSLSFALSFCFGPRQWLNLNLKSFRIVFACQKRPVNCCHQADYIGLANAVESRVYEGGSWYDAAGYTYLLSCLSFLAEFMRYFHCFLCKYSKYIFNSFF